MCHRRKYTSCIYEVCCIFYRFINSFVNRCEFMVLAFSDIVIDANLWVSILPTKISDPLGKSSFRVKRRARFIAATADYADEQNTPNTCRGRFIAPTADSSALAGWSCIRIILLKAIIGTLSSITLKDGGPTS